MSNQTYTEKQAEPTAEPNDEHTAEHTGDANAAATGENTAEPNAEPTSEPTIGTIDSNDECVTSKEARPCMSNQTYTVKHLAQ